MNMDKELEEAAEALYPYDGYTEEHIIDNKRWSFTSGAKWQAERMYSEKEVESLLHKFMQSQKPNWHGYSTAKWFEQFKK